MVDRKIIIIVLVLLGILLTISTSQAADFNDLNTKIQDSAGVLFLDSNYTDNSSTGVKIIINKNITIDGQNHTLNFNNKSSTHFNISREYQVTLKNIILINAQANMGGVIVNNGSVILDNISFMDNYASSGGAIYNTGNLSINNTLFMGNKAKDGGAIYNTGNLSIINTNFGYNSVNKTNPEDYEINATGGAIYNYQGQIKISDSLFAYNSAYGTYYTGAAGAIYNLYGIVNISDSQFLNNTAEGDGGVIFNYGVLNITSSQFTSNYGVNGGVIQNIMEIIIKNSVFTKNNATGDGGAIQNHGIVNISDSQFINNWVSNHVAGAGGAIDNTRFCFINKTVFLNNTASFTGGAIKNSNTLILLDSNFTTNEAFSGGAINNTGLLNITKSIFTGNKAVTGGGVHNNYGLTNVQDSLFINNTAEQSSGGIENYYGVLIVTNTSFNINSAHQGGGAIQNHGELNISNSQFNNNTANNGGAIYNRYILNISSSSFKDNVASGSSGTIYNENLLNIFNSNFTNNKSIVEIVNNGELNMKNSQFMDSNTASVYNIREALLDNVIFKNNRDAEGIILNEGNLIINNSQFKNNTVLVGIIVTGQETTSYGGNLTILNSNFTNNIGLFSGAISNSAKTIIKDSNFRNNTGTYGAILNQGTINITRSSFTENKGTGHGTISNYGTLYIRSSILMDNRDYAIFTNNTNKGSSLLDVSSTIFINNTLYSNGTSNNKADGNYWGNDTPILTQLSNFPINNYYRFSLGNNINTNRNTNVDIILTLRLNTTNNADWEGLSIIIGDTIFTTTPSGASINKINYNSAVFKSSNTGKYLITGTSNKKNYRLWVNVAKTTPTISISAPSNVIYGNQFTIKITLKDKNTPLNKQKIYIKYKKHTYSGITNTKGIASIKMPKLKPGTYKFTIQYNGNTNYYTVSKKTNNIKINPLKITNTKPYNGQKGYSQTRTFVITFNQKIKKSSKYNKIYIRNLNTRLYVTFTKKIIGNKLYIKMKAKRYKKHYYRIYIPRYSITNKYGKTISKTRTIKFRT